MDDRRSRRIAKEKDPAAGPTQPPLPGVAIASLAQPEPPITDEELVATKKYWKGEDNELQHQQRSIMQKLLENADMMPQGETKQVNKGPSSSSSSSKSEKSDKAEEKSAPLAMSRAAPQIMPWVGQRLEVALVGEQGDGPFPGRFIVGFGKPPPAEGKKRKGDHLADSTLTPVLQNETWGMEMDSVTSVDLASLQPTVTQRAALDAALRDLFLIEGAAALPIKVVLAFRAD